MNRKHDTGKSTASGAKLGYGKGVIITIAAIFTAIAVALCCMLGIDNSSKSVSVDGVQGGEVTHSATARTPSLSGATVNDYSTTALYDGDTFTMTGTNNYYTIKLPSGKYYLEVWGAQGGAGYGSVAGGYGGYAKALYTITATTTIYVYVGGAGSAATSTNGATTAGGYNGGGSTKYNRTCGHRTSSGGGATHIATRSGLLSALSSYKTTDVLIVGGGGGGGGYSTGTGGSGGPTGGTATYGSYTNTATGGSTSAGGTSSVGSSYYSSMTTVGSSGSFGQGGAGAIVSSGAGGAGGGGGYFGGAGGSGGAICYGAPGGGGSNFIKSGLTVVSNTTQSSLTGNGKAVITVINQEPKTNNYTKTLTTRAAGTYTTITASNLAYDPDGTSTAVYFSNGTAGAYDTYSNFKADGGLYLDSACTVSATKYFTWTTSTNVSFAIKAKNYPRTGQTGVTSGGGTVTLYTKIRDNYGSSTATRACSTISFKLTVPKETISLKTAVNSTVVNSSGQSSTVSNPLGSSTLTTAPDDPSTASGIYNPSGTGRSTLFLKNMLTLGSKITISAANLLSGHSTSFDQAVIAIPSLTSITGSARKFKVTEVDAGTNKVTSYTPAVAAIANTYSQITLECVSPTPGYMVLPVTVYLVEKTACNGTNVGLWDSSGGTVSYSFEIAFKMQNTRPILKSGQSNLVDVTAGSTAALSLNTYFSDADASSGITTSTHAITGVIVPKKEFVLIDAQQKVVAATNYNVGYTTGQVIGETDAAFTTTATGSTDTGFVDNIAYNTTAPVSGVTLNEAFISYTYSGITLNVTGLRASFSQYKQSRANALGHFYLLIHIQDKSDLQDNGIWLPIAITVGNATSHTPVATVTAPNSLTLQSAVSAFPTADGASGDSFYFAPMAINYNGSYVIGKYKDGEGNLTNNNLQPLAIDGDNFATSTGLAGWSSNGNPVKLNEFLKLSITPEALVKGMTQNGAGAQQVGSGWENQYIRAEIIPIYIDKSLLASVAYGGGRVVAGSGTNANGYLYANLTEASDETGYYTIDGLKITLKSATMNRYVYAQAAVSDVTNRSVSGINIAIRVKNTALGVYSADSGNVVTFGNPLRDSAYSTYEYAENGTPTFTYKIPYEGTVIITPYDLAYDFDMRTAGASSAGGFTLNGYSGWYDSASGTLNTSANGAGIAFNGLIRGGSYNSNAVTFLNTVQNATTVTKVSSTAAGTASSSATAANAAVYRDKLFFERTTNGSDAFTYNPTTFNDINVVKANTTNFVNVYTGSTVKIGDSTYPIDFIMLTALNRTTQPSVIDLVIRDRYGNGSSDGSSSAAVRIIVEVTNTKPVIKDEYRYEEISVKPISSGDTVVTPDSRLLYANGNGDMSGLMTDLDRDVPEYVLQSGVLIVNKLFIDDYNNNSLVDEDDETIDNLYFDSFEGLNSKYTVHGGLLLSSYLTATLTSRSELTVTAISSTKAIEGGVYVAFFVTDNSGGTSLGYVRIEVINTAPVLNESDEDGFDKENPLWRIESTSDGDIMRSRYIVGSELAKRKLKSEKAALDIDIKLIAIDEDGLHSKVMLSQIVNVGDNEALSPTYRYINLDRSEELSGEPLRTALNAAVPSIGTDASNFNDRPSAIKIFDTIPTHMGAPSGYNTEIYFWLGDADSGAWYERGDLIDGLMGSTQAGVTVDKIDIDDCFDSYGRFIIADWALLLHATSGFQDNESAGILFSLRDQAELGGDTAGFKTAYNSDRFKTNDAGELDNRAVVDGRLITTVYQHISQTGIRSINEYLGQNNNYYTVEYTPASTKTPIRFISTYDGRTDSTYDEAQSSLYFKDDGTVNHKMVLDYDGGDDTTLIKSRGAGEADNTLAGINSGAVYSGTGEVAGAFRYSDTIEVPAALDTGSANLATGESDRVKYKSVYVPMSYFGLLSTLVGAKSNEPNKGSVVYPIDEYVGYEMPVGKSYSLLDTNAILGAMTLSDGTYMWAGASIADNPYITIGTFDWYHDNNPETNSARLATDPYSSPYYNNRLAVPTLSPDDDSLLGYEQYADNRKSFVGDGRLMYLENQARELIEHNFGLIFTKKSVRTSTRSLTLTINLARCKGSQVAATDGVINEKDKRTVEIKIHVENSMMDLYYNNFSDDFEGKSTTVKYDEQKGTYYMDLTLASSDTWSYTLTRRNASNATVMRDGHTIEYYDDDYGTADKRDFAYFASDSFMQLSMWQVGEAGYNRVLQLTDDEAQFSNVLATSEYAQKSVANYFGATYGSLDEMDIDKEYQANRGLYGVRGKDGYSSYFNASVTNSGQTLNIMPIHKTWINELAFSMAVSGDSLYGVNTDSQEEVSAAYAARGLIAKYDSILTPALTPDRVYYPFKVLIYDSYGVGFLDASYVSIEFRIQITNGDPTLKAVGNAVGSGREFTMNLAVNNTVDINLYDIVYDSDIFTYTERNIGRLATATEFKARAKGIDLETGDYLLSPIIQDEYKDRQYNPSVQVDSDGVYYYNGAGFSAAGNTERDIVMSMELKIVDDDDVHDEPVSNVISFKVNRRTTATYNGRSVSVNRYKFTLCFYDSEGRATAPFTFVINVTNQTPSITQVTRSFTMRAGDDLTVLTAYYDVFTGARGGITSAYRNSDTYAALTERENMLNYGEDFGDGYNNDLGSGNYWKFKDITLNDEGQNIIYDSTGQPRNKHLGYVGLASDDTPWRLRFTNWTESNDRIYVYSQQMLGLPAEGAESGTQQIALRIMAVAACTNEPFTVTISDGEGGIISCTLYITIVSSPPIARDCTDITDNQTVTAGGLEGVFNTSGSLEQGVFAAYIVPADGTHTFNIEGVGQKTARRVTTIKMSTVAKDPDGATETNNMRLYGNGEFELHDIQADTWQPIVSDSSGVFKTNYFNIAPSLDRVNFTITATGYDPDTTDGYTEIRFRVADFGDSAYENTILITLRVFTLYSDLTNPTASAKTGNAYTNYLRGSDLVNVKSYDFYFNPENHAEESKYAFIRLADSEGNDGNDLSPIVDPDATSLGDAVYNVRLYAFFNINENGSISALSSEAISRMLNKNADGKIFGLKTETAGDYTAYADYMIGGLLADGTTLSLTYNGQQKLNKVLQYAEFEFSSDGTSLTLTPKASTLNSPEFLLYIEAEKPLGNRAYKRTDAVLNAGALFRLNVLNSAPRAVDGRHEVEGVKGTVGTFTVFDPDDRYGALFIDSDNGDNVSVVGIVNGKLAESEYTNVMAEAMRTMAGLDWQANASSGKPRAFDIGIDEAGKLQITINRRIDYVVNGVYQPSVTIPLVITGADVVGDRITTTVYLTINNSNLSTVASYSHEDEETQVGYSFGHDSNDEPVIDVRLRYGTPLEVNLADFLRDNDMDDDYDADSYRFVLPQSQGGYTYLTDEEISVNWYDTDENGVPNLDFYKELAKAAPVGADSMHRTGILFTAAETERNITATVYVRVIDRSANANVAANGIIIKINVSVMNDAPYVLEGKETTEIYMIGTEDENAEPASMLFFIGDFVADRNKSDVVGDEESAKNPDTALRISRQEAREISKIYSQTHDSIPNNSGAGDLVLSSALFEVTLPTQLDERLINDYIKRMGKDETFVKNTTNDYNQWFVITPRNGY